MTTQMLKTRSRRSKHRWPMPALVERRDGRSNDEGLSRNSFPISSDPDLDRWFNEGGAHWDHPTFAQDRLAMP
jgi:hypothetical protein